MRRNRVYDIAKGHYVLLEDDAQNNNQNTGVDVNNNQEEVKVGRKSIDADPEIQKLNTEKQNIKQRYQTEKATQEKLLNDAKASASAVDGSDKVYDPVRTNSNVLNIQKKILDLDLKYAQDINRIENNRLQILKRMANESYELPEKYRFLNESNIHQAKIYVNKLVQNDEYHLMKGMSDFKKVFSKSELVYGKDKSGYYVLCVDQDDFNKMYDTLQEEGYLRDEIISTIMPQILDRSSMLSDK